MKVALMPNPTREQAKETTDKLCIALDKFGISYDFIYETDEISDSTDLVIAIGGDGTMIRAAKLALFNEIPVLGVNAGNLAFLMGLETDEMTLLNKLLTKDYYIEERLVVRIDVFNKKNESVMSDYCINDAVFARGAAIKLSSFELYCDSRFINSYTSDGLIIATPTGSTAYNLAAGGPIVDPRVEGIILSPICPHSLVERTVLFSANSVLKIKNPGNTSKILLSCDGRDAVDFNEGYSAEIRKADKKAKFLRLKDDTFLDILHKKMKIK